MRLFDNNSCHLGFTSSLKLSGVISFKLIFWLMLGESFIISGMISFCNFWEIFSEFSTQMKASALKEELGEFYPAYEQVKRIAHDDPIQARMDFQVIY